jgi:hypothetical protein
MLSATRGGEDGSVGRPVRRLRRQDPNCLPITPGWNYMVRLYRPRAEMLKESFPQAQRPEGATVWRPLNRGGARRPGSRVRQAVVLPLCYQLAPTGAFSSLLPIRWMLEESRL